MAPKSAASIRATALKASGMTRAEAATTMLTEFPDLTASRRSQLLTAAYGKMIEHEGSKANQDGTTLLATPIKSRKAFLLDLKSRGVSLKEAKKMIQTEFPNMSPSQRSQLFSAH
jgi:hypothetical protein